MRYYVDTIEETKSGDEYSEYGKRVSKATYDGALSAFYDGLSTVSKSKAHVYFDIKIVDSNGGILKKDKIGEYVNVEG